MIRTLIIEDEKPAARKLERTLSAISGLNVVANLSSVEEGIAWFSKQEHPDLIFCDIVLGDGLSFDIFEQIPTKSFIIYTTAFDSYTLRAFKLNSIDYLLKPIQQDDLLRAIEKYKSFIPQDQHYKELNFKELIKKEKACLSRILVKTGYQLKIIQTKDTSYFYSENKIVYAQTQERAFPTEFTLEELQETLDQEKFFRVSRQVIINLDFIKNIQTSPVYKVQMEHQQVDEITISRERVKEFKDWLSK